MTMRPWLKCSDPERPGIHIAGSCARNIWYVCALADIDIQYVHVRGLDYKATDLLSSWTGTQNNFTELYRYIQDPVWIPVDKVLLEIDPEL